MTAFAQRIQETPMAPYVALLRGMNREQKLAVVAFLVDTMQDEEEMAQHKTDDEDFVKEMQALRYDGRLSADEMKLMLRESHHFGGRNIKPLYDGE